MVLNVNKQIILEITLLERNSNEHWFVFKNLPVEYSGRFKTTKVSTATSIWNYLVGRFGGNRITSEKIREKINEMIEIIKNREERQNFDKRVSEFQVEFKELLSKYNLGCVLERISVDEYGECCDFTSYLYDLKNEDFMKNFDV